MIATTSDFTSNRWFSLENVLLNYLIDAVPGRISGCEGMTTRQMVGDYARLARQGMVPGLPQLQRWHPHFQRELQEFFGGPEDIRGLKAEAVVWCEESTPAHPEARRCTRWP